MRPPVLYIYARSTAFIEKDIELLSIRFQVHRFEFAQGTDLMLPWWFLRQLAWLIAFRCWRHDAICHFSGYHSLLPALFCRRCFIILAGSDAASFPNINYGNHRKWMYGRATRASIRRATRLLPVDGSLIRSVQTYDPSSPREQGVRAFVDPLPTPYTVIHYGFDADYWNPLPGITREPNRFICSAMGCAPGNAVHYRKGMDLILYAARELPNAVFVVVGSERPERYRDLPANLNVLGKLDKAALRAEYCRSTFVLQVSIMEGFPNALCEGMLCGCIPVASNVAAMPEIVDGTGYILDRRDPSLFTELLEGLLRLDFEERNERSRNARDRIAAAFTATTRFEELDQVLRTS